MLKRKPDFNAQRIAGQAYYDRWKQLNTSGVKPYVLSKADHRDEWEAWRRYYRAHGLWAMLELMDDGRMEKTVPTKSPADFDPQVFVEVWADRRVKDD